MWSTPSRLSEPSTDSMICGMGGGLVSSLGLALTLTLTLALALVTWSRVTRVPLPSSRNQVKRSL